MREGCGAGRSRAPTGTRDSGFGGRGTSRVNPAPSIRSRADCEACRQPGLAWGGAGIYHFRRTPKGMSRHAWLGGRVEGWMRKRVDEQAAVGRRRKGKGFVIFHWRFGIEGSVRLGGSGALRPGPFDVAQGGCAGYDPTPSAAGVRTTAPFSGFVKGEAPAFPEAGGRG